MAKVFISYRRADAQHQADRLYALLRKHLPTRDVFIDIDGIALGADFENQLQERLRRCRVMLVLIGPTWLQAKREDTNTRRLDDPADYVRKEIAAALQKRILVVPVLLDGAIFPNTEDLPDELRELTRKQAIELRRNAFDADAARLIQKLGIAGRRIVLASVGASAFTAIAALGLFLNFRPMESVSDAPSVQEKVEARLPGRELSASEPIDVTPIPVIGEPPAVAITQLPSAEASESDLRQGLESGQQRTDIAPDSAYHDSSSANRTVNSENSARLADRASPSIDHSGPIELANHGGVTLSYTSQQAGDLGVLLEISLICVGTPRQGPAGSATARVVVKTGAKYEPYSVAMVCGSASDFAGSLDAGSRGVLSRSSARQELFVPRVVLSDRGKSWVVVGVATDFIERGLASYYQSPPGEIRGRSIAEISLSQMSPKVLFEDALSGGWVGSRSGMSAALDAIRQTTMEELSRLAGHDVTVWGAQSFSGNEAVAADAMNVVVTGVKNANGYGGRPVQKLDKVTLRIAKEMSVTFNNGELVIAINPDSPWVGRIAPDDITRVLKVSN